MNKVKRMLAALIYEIERIKQEKIDVGAEFPREIDSLD